MAPGRTEVFKTARYLATRIVLQSNYNKRRFRGMQHNKCF